MKNNKDVYFILPGFYEHYELYDTFLSYIKDNPNLLKEGAHVYGVFGNFQPCTWDGGRIFKDIHPASLEKMKQIKETYNDKYNLPVRFIFTNTLLEEGDLFERYNNISLDLFHDGKNEIVVNSPRLEEYIINNYPNYKLISSTTKCITNIENAKDELNKTQYQFVCLDYNLNHNKQFLENLTDEEKAKTELLINPICGPACPHRKDHYDLNSMQNLNYGKEYKMRGCRIDKSTLFYREDWPTIIQPDEVYGRYADMGFKYFKIEGRTWSNLSMIEALAKYLIKPEQQLFVVEEILSILAKNNIKII